MIKSPPESFCTSGEHFSGSDMFPCYAVHCISGYPATERLNFPQADLWDITAIFLTLRDYWRPMYES
jgi:hypothetical protein